MSFKTIQDIINFYQKEPKSMNNVNYNPEKLADFKELARERRQDHKNRRTLVDARIRQVDPSYRITPDEIVDISEGEE